MTVSDADRERAIAALREQAAEGRLDMDEYGQRLDEAYSATTLDELRHALRELPVVLSSPAQQQAPPRSQPTGPWQAPRPGRPGRPGAPARLPMPHATGKVADAAWATHRNVYVAVIGMLVVIWLLSGGGYFWPIWPAMGWGIGLVAHGSAHAAARSRRRDS